LESEAAIGNGSQVLRKILAPLEKARGFGMTPLRTRARLIQYPDRILMLVPRFMSHSMGLRGYHWEFAVANFLGNDCEEISSNVQNSCTKVQIRSTQHVRRGSFGCVLRAASGQMQ
jgi:hypothetical protein